MKAGWQSKRLGNLCELISGRHIDAKDYNNDEKGIGYLTGPSDFGLKYPTITKWTENPLVTALPGDILITVKGSGVGRINFMHHAETAISRQLMAIRVKAVESKFLYLYLLSIFEHLQSASTGAAIPGLSREQILALEIPIPPLPEQRRIVGILDEAFAGLATAEANAARNLQNAREIFDSHLHAVFSQRGKGWVDRKLHTLCREITVGYVGPMAREYTKSGVTFLRSQNIRPFQVSLENALYIRPEFDAKIAKSRLRPGDVAVVRTGYPGTAAVIPPSLPESNCADLVIVRPGLEVESQFLAAFFNSSYGKEHVAGKVVGAAQKHFNVGAAKETVLYLPPLKEQRTIVAKFDALAAETQRLTRLYEQKQAALAALKKSLLHCAFSGEL